MQLLPAYVLPAHVVDAEARLVEALHRLDRLQLAAFFGDDYDSEEYDAAVMAYRHARRVLAAARRRAQPYAAIPYALVS